MSEYEYDFSKGVEQYKRIINGGEADWVPVTTQMAEFCMALATSSGWPSRPNGSFAAPDTSWSSLKNLRSPGVSIQPGWTMFTRMRC